MTTNHSIHRPEQEALFLLAPSEPPARFRLDDATVTRGRLHIARIRNEIAERRALSALSDGIAPERAELGARARRRRRAA